MTPIRLLGGATARARELVVTSNGKSNEDTPTKVEWECNTLCLLFRAGQDSAGQGRAGQGMARQDI
jgi:hypothetical protein